MSTELFIKFSERARAVEVITASSGNFADMAQNVMQGAVDMLSAQPGGMQLAEQLVSIVGVSMTKQRAAFGLPPLPPRPNDCTCSGSQKTSCAEVIAVCGAACAVGCI